MRMEASRRAVISLLQARGEWDRKPPRYTDTGFGAHGRKAPEGWLDYRPWQGALPLNEAAGWVLPMKCPLSEKWDGLPPGEAFPLLDVPQAVAAACGVATRLVLVIDLTNTKNYYDSAEVAPTLGAPHLKIMVPGKQIKKKKLC